MNVYENCPVLEDSQYLLRLVKTDDVNDLLEVYSDKNALPFFNSDNCDGDNFYYPDKEKMEAAVGFWVQAHENKWFVRWAIVDKTASKVIGTIEMFHRTADDDFNDVVVLRLDVRSDYERSDVLQALFALIVPSSYDLFYCSEVITKIPNYAIERIDAARKYGFIKSDSLMIGTNDHYAYNGYWTIKRN